MNKLVLKPFTKEQKQQMRRESFGQAREPWMWKLQAEQLWADARTLWDARVADRKARTDAFNRMTEFSEADKQSLSCVLDHTDRTAFFLMGLAIENAMKSVFLAECPDAISREKLEAKFPASGHDLVKLKSRLVCISEIGIDRRLLEGLSDHLCWLGKYPAPKKWEDVDYQLNVADFERSEDLLRWLFKALLLVQQEKKENQKNPTDLNPN